jgi:hypothetical protein
MPVLRFVLGGIGVILLGGAGVALRYGAPAPAVFMPVIFGALFLVAACFERVIYKKVAPRAPGGEGWIATDERFVDPATGRLVQVHFKPETGERSYVDAGPAPPER